MEIYIRNHTQPFWEETVQHHFEALGIQFLAKNYAMGNYNSAPELALCINEVFGGDIDVLE